jgi:hypothetical protein
MKASFAVCAATAAALALAGCGSSPHAASYRNVSYKNATAVVAALDAHGAPCTSAYPASGMPMPGAIPGLRGPFMECSGLTQGDTSIGVFDSYADALQQAMSVLGGGGPGLQPPSTAEVVGPDWLVNTTPAYAKKVHAAIGGQVLH